MTSFFDSMGKATKALGLDFSHVAYDLARAVHPDDMDTVLGLLTHQKIAPEPDRPPPPATPPISMPGQPLPQQFADQAGPGDVPSEPLVSDGAPPVDEAIA